MKTVFVISPLRGSPVQLAAIEKRVQEARDGWTDSAGGMDPVAWQSCASRLRAKLQTDLYAENTRLAERLCLEASILGVAPFAPHLFFTRFLRDTDPHDREAGIAGGLAWLKACDEVWVYSRYGISAGMAHEIAAAIGLGKSFGTPAGWKP